MNHTAETDEFVPHSEAARIRGVSSRTIDRWIAAGILQRPEKINGRKYHKRRNLLQVEELA
jgi:DNA-binding transcriptional MerR regulator